MEYLAVEICPVCHAPDKKIYYKATRNQGRAVDPADYACTSSGYGRYPDIYQCQQCQLIYSSQRPSPEGLEKIYSDIEDNIYLKEEAGRIKTFQRGFADLNALCRQKRENYLSLELTPEFI